MTGIIAPNAPEDDGIDVTDVPEHVAAVRDLVLRAHPEIVPELLREDSIGGLLASVQPATDAYARIAGGLTLEDAADPVTPRVPAGGSPAVLMDAETLPAAEKIRRGLESRRRG